MGNLLLSVLSFLWSERGRVGILLMGVLLLALTARCHTLRTTLAAERAVHNATLHALDDALREGDRWVAVAREAYASAAIVSDYADACLKREADAATATAERGAILSTVQPRQRTEAERQEVVDDASRMAAAARLNRPW